MVRHILTAALIVLTGTGSLSAGERETVRIGIPRSVFRDVPPALLAFANQPFKDLMKAQAGIDGEVANDVDSMNIARDLDTGKLELGVFLGHEFAWARMKFPKLEPLVIAVPRPREVQAFILVRHDCKAETLSDLKGCKLVTGTNTRDHARLFLDRRQLEDLGGGGFCTLKQTTTIHDALHSVIDGDADLTVADQASWNYFQKLYPGPSQNLKVLSKSEVFPSTVIAFKKGTLDEKLVKRLHDGLLTAHQNPKGANLMKTIKMEKFDDLPAQYSQSLKDIIKVYPAPPAYRAAADKK